MDWASLSGNLVTNAGVGTNSDGRLEVFAPGTDKAVYQDWQFVCSE